MNVGDVIEIRTINKKGVISFVHYKIKDVALTQEFLADIGYKEIEPNVFFCTHQYDKKGGKYGNIKKFEACPARQAENKGE